MTASFFIAHPIVGVLIGLVTFIGISAIVMVGANALSQGREK